MAFDRQNLVAVAYGAGRSVWFYDTEDDLAAVSAAGYFNEMRAFFGKGSIIHVRAADDFTSLRVTESYPVLITVAEMSAVGFTAAGTGAVQRTVRDKLRERVSPEDFGAKGDGVADDTAAILRAEAALAPGQELVFGPKTYRITQPFTVTRQRAAWRGAGHTQTVILYDGASTTADILTVGNGTAAIIGCSFRDFRVASNVTMTAGYGLRLKKFCRSTVSGFVADGQDGNGKLWNGVYFDEVDMVRCLGFEARAQNVGVSVRGATGSGPKADLFLGGGFKIAKCGLGLLCGGAFGGLYVDEGGLINNGVNVRIDTSLVAEANREIFFGPLLAIDMTTTGPGVHVNHPITSACWIGFEGTWIASAATHGLHIESFPGGRVQVLGGTLYNCGGDGVRVDDASPIVQIAGPVARNNAGWGVNATVVATNVSVSAVFAGNTLGTFNGNVQGRPISSGFGLDGTAYWTKQGANPIQTWDANDYDLYDRAANRRDFTIGGTAVLRLRQTFNESAVPFQLPTYTVATLPAAASFPRSLISVSDGASNKRLAISDGANWRWPDGAIVS